MIINLLDFQWHDSRIKFCNFESSNSSFDRIVLMLENDSFVDQFGKNEIQVIFRDCYNVKMDFHLWITRLDTINSIEVLNESSWIESEMRKLGNQFRPKQIWHLILRTNTNSTLELMVAQKDSVEIL